MSGSRAMKIKQAWGTGDLSGAGGGKDTAPGALPARGWTPGPRFRPPPHGTLGPLRGPERLSTALTSPLPVLPTACPSPLSEPWRPSDRSAGTPSSLITPAWVRRASSPGNTLCPLSRDCGSHTAQPLSLLRAPFLWAAVHASSWPIWLDHDDLSVPLSWFPVVYLLVGLRSCSAGGAGPGCSSSVPCHSRGAPNHPPSTPSP